MIIDIIVPEAGESITQVELARWLVQDGQYVYKDQEIAEIDSDKATLTINASEGGIIRLSIEEGSSTEPGKIIGKIDTSASAPAGEGPVRKSESGATDTSATQTNGGNSTPEALLPPADKVAPASSGTPHTNRQEPTISPQAKKLLDEMDIEVSTSTHLPDGRRITKKEILAAVASAVKDRQSGTGSHTTFLSGSGIDAKAWGGNRDEERQKMSTLRRKIAERLVAVKNQTAMLTTFNEVDMSAVIAIRKKYQDAFVKKYGFKLGFMSFFAKALAESIPYFPQVNGYIDGQFMVIPGYADIGIAVSTPKGLMVPVIRNAESLSIPELEENIQQLAARARENKISLEELKGGTISITNGGIFGSMLSTPIINPPQSAILGMHNIVDRPVAIDGKVVIRPMMYLALSYDHRIIDGKESVGFLVKVKEMIENPATILSGGKAPEQLLIGL